jgi:hypothetical protein
MGLYQIGLTVMGSGAPGVRGLQISANWNYEELAPQGLRFRVNDETGTTGAWGAFRTLWDQGNLTALSQLSNDLNYVTQTAGDARYVLVAGDTMTGALTTTTLNATTAVISGIATGGNLISVNNITANTGDIIAKTGQVVVGTTGGTNGTLRLQAGIGNITGYVEFWGLTARQGYIGYATTGAALNYISEAPTPAHSFTGSITSNSNITAFSDIRVKRDIQLIPDALEKVKSLRGVTFERTDLNSARQTGLIAQEVQSVLPEAVLEGEDGMLSVAYGNMVGLLVEAVKAQQKQIDALVAALAAR